MNNRRDFIRNTILGLCATLLPEIIRPNEIKFDEKYLIGCDPYAANDRLIVFKRRRGGEVYAIHADASEEFKDQVKWVMKYYHRPNFKTND